MPNITNLNNKFILTYTFFNGLVITALEMTASRFLAPFFGTSSIVWANIIGVILTSLAIGYYIGGRISRGNVNNRIYYSLGLFGGVLSLLLPLISDWVLKGTPFLVNRISSVESLGSFIVTIIVFGVPVLFLAMLSPLGVVLINKKIEDVGSYAGRLYALSTIGSVVGIYLSTFVTIPYWGVRNTFIGLSGLIIVLSIIGLGIGSKIVIVGKKIIAIVILLCLLSFATSTTSDKSTLFDQDGLYQRVKVLKRNQNNLLVFNEGAAVQSINDSTSPFIGLTDDDKLKTSWYTNYYYILPFLNQFQNNQKLNILILGYAGGGVGKVLKASGKEINIDAVELDPLVNQVSLDYMGVKPNDRNINIMDARNYIITLNPKTRYDIVVLDTYANNINMPAHLLTNEYFNQIQKFLSPQGVVAINFNSKDPNGKLLLRTLNTISQSFNNLEYSNTNSNNYMIIGSSAPIGIKSDDKDLNKYFNIFEQNKKSFIPNPNYGIFTDDLNNSELLAQFEQKL
jgi:hypothetical protein